MQRNISLNYRRPVFGVGINDADYKTQELIDGKNVVCKIYQTWYDVMRRVYSPVSHKANPTYVDASVCEEWHTFSTFKAWMDTQDWEGKALDKDILVPNNKHYSPETCCFVTQALNSLLSGRSRRDNGAYPVGVSYHAPRGTYVARVNMYGKRKSVGYYPTPEAAGEAYRQARSDYIRAVADEQTDERIAEGLRKHAELIKGEG